MIQPEPQVLQTYFILKGRFQLSCGNYLYTYTSFLLFKFISVTWRSFFSVLSFLCSLFSMPWAGFFLQLYFNLLEFHVRAQFCSYSGSSITSKVQVGKPSWKWHLRLGGHSTSVQYRANPEFNQVDLNKRSCFFRSHLCSVTHAPATSLADPCFACIEVTWREPWPRGTSWTLPWSCFP